MLKTRFVPLLPVIRTSGFLQNKPDFFYTYYDFLRSGNLKSLSSSVLRHSFANCLKQKGVATDIISESMGHQNLTVTHSYLK